MKSHFDVLFLVGRPASGKSEIIDFLSHLPADFRRERYHLGELDVLDDFPMLWSWFEEDHILSEKMGKARLHTDDAGYFLEPHFWHLLVERLDMEYYKRLRTEDYHQSHTALIEFARGSEHGGYRAAFEHFSSDTLSRAAVTYVNVSLQESLRKNRKRFNPDRPDSILEHSLPDDKLKRLYKDDDWFSIAGNSSGFLEFHSLQIPYVVFENEEDITSGNANALGERLASVLDTLWRLYSDGH